MLIAKRVPIDSVHQDPSNARQHPEENMAAIVASLRRFGQVEPLVVQKSTGRIIGGNGRHAAMKSIGWTDCDVVEVDVDDLNATSLGIALNRTAELAEWNPEILGKLLSELRTQDSLDGVGFDTVDVDKILKDIGADLESTGAGGVDDPGAVEPPATPVTKRGDLWILGDHRLLCGDSTNHDDITRLMNGEKAALFATDPPYGVDYTGERPGKDGTNSSGKDWTDLYREIDIKDFQQFISDMLGACLPHVVENSGIYIWHADRKIYDIKAACDKHEILLHQHIIWVKPTATLGHSFYQWRHEPCVFGWRQGHKPEHRDSQLSTIWEADWDGKSRFATFHPTSKPTRLFEIPMEQHTKIGDVCLEPFNGSGSQIMAAEKMKRRCYAMEIQPAFIDGTITRWETATGRKAVLARS